MAILNVGKTLKYVTILLLLHMFRPEYILNCIWDGKVAGVLAPRHRSIDIDDDLDFSIARFLMEKSQNDR